MSVVIKPQRLQQGDTIGIIAPASPPDISKAVKAERFFNELGLRVEFGDSLKRRDGYLAGTDAERAEEIHRMFSDDRIDGIFSVCGGYGTGRIASRLNYDLIRSNPKIFWGYSDLTFLHTSIQQQTGLVTFHGPMLSSDLGEETIHPLTRQSFQNLFKPGELSYTEAVTPLKIISQGRASGQLIGGNLSLLVSTLGTPFEVHTKGKLFFIEEVDEEPYQIDRMLNQLKMSGKFEEAAGILLCDFHDCVPKKPQQSLTLDEVFRDHLGSSGKPVLSGFKIGHCTPHFAVPIGVSASMDAKAKSLFIHESGVK